MGVSSIDDKSGIRGYDEMEELEPDRHSSAVMVATSKRAQELGRATLIGARVPSFKPKFTPERSDATGNLKIVDFAQQYLRMQRTRTVFNLE
jgi:hypothetical protein